MTEYLRSNKAVNSSIFHAMLTDIRLSIFNYYIWCCEPSVINVLCLFFPFLYPDIVLEVSQINLGLTGRDTRVLMHNSHINLITCRINLVKENRKLKSKALIWNYFTVSIISKICFVIIIWMNERNLALRSLRLFVHLSRLFSETPEGMKLKLISNP